MFNFNYVHFNQSLKCNKYFAAKLFALLTAV